MVFAGISPNSARVFDAHTQTTLKVLLPVNDRESGEAIVEHVLHHDWPSGTEFRLVQVMDWVPTEKEVAASRELRDYAEQKREEAHALLHGFADRLQEGLSDVVVEHEIREGHAAEQIIAAAHGWQADHIIMGSHKRNGISLFFKGSVSSAVAEHADCDVTTIKLN